MSSTFTTLQVTEDPRGGCTISLDRPKVHNAFNEVMIEEMTNLISDLRSDASIRFMTIRGTGKSFCAGADLDWMRRTAQYDEDQNIADARRFATLCDLLYRFPRPTIAEVHGSVFGGGVGIVACCDIVIADIATVFSVSEVKLGLMPSVIAPYVIEAIGRRNARRYFLTAERFDAKTAKNLGLVHEVYHQEELPAAREAFINELLKGGPNAQQKAKALIQSLKSIEIDQDTLDETAKRIAELRATPEASEGMSAFFEKRPPNWIN